MEDQSARDRYYLELFTSAVEKCANYRPALGQGRAGGVSLEEFQRLYSADPFYAWIGLNSPLMYAAHKAAGGMTSIYRQIGIGCERIFQAILRDRLGLTTGQVAWAYQAIGPNDKSVTRKLDGRINITDVADPGARERVEKWFGEVAAKLLVTSDVLPTLVGAVFEVRQGYKSMDSKRQGGDISNASSAYLNRYIPVLLLVSTQIDTALVDRYTRERWLILTGAVDGPTTSSTYAFCREVLGYDWAAFFERNASSIKETVTQVLSTLLRA